MKFACLRPTEGSLPPSCERNVNDPDRDRTRGAKGGNVEALLEVKSREEGLEEEVHEEGEKALVPGGASEGASHADADAAIIARTNKRMASDFSYKADDIEYITCKFDYKR